MATSKIEWTWKPVRGFDDYFASISGSIRGPSGKIMKQSTMPSGHKYVLCNRGKGNQRKLFVHRAVLLAFVGLPRKGNIVRHLDGNPSNNSLSNLVWGTQKENAQDKYKHGTMPLSHNAKDTKFSPSDIPNIRNLHEQGMSSRAIGTRYNVSHTTIQKIIRGERWKGY